MNLRMHKPVYLTRRILPLATVLLVVSFAFPSPLTAKVKDRGGERWIGTWTASPQPPEPPVVVPVPAQFDNQTVRQIVRTSIGGKEIRVRLSNEFGTVPLTIGAASIARHSKAASIIAGTDRMLTFSGQSSITIPTGAPVLSDPVQLDVPALSNLAISIYLPNVTAANTFHLLGLSTTYVSPPGDYSEAVVMPTASTTDSWFFLTGVSVAGFKRDYAVIALGDSITDGYASTSNANHRWPDLLAARLQMNRNWNHLAVLNHGISGNRTLFDSFGPNALARLDRDVLNAPGAEFVIVMEGINNIGVPGVSGRLNETVTTADIIAGHKQIILRAHERGLKVYGGTLTPFEGTTFPGYFTAEGEIKRQAVNAWIRTSGAFDGVIDFDKAIRDPLHPTRMLPAYDSGDHLHPNDAGYQVMAGSIDLSLFR